MARKKKHGNITKYDGLVHSVDHSGGPYVSGFDTPLINPGWVDQQIEKKRKLKEERYDSWTMGMLRAGSRYRTDFDEPVYMGVDPARMNIDQYEDRVVKALVGKAYALIGTHHPFSNPEGAQTIEQSEKRHDFARKIVSKYSRDGELTGLPKMVLTTLITDLKDIQPEPKPKKERKQGMNHTLTALLVDTEGVIKTVGVQFSYKRAVYVYKTVEDLKEGDLVIVEVGTNLDKGIFGDEEYDFEDRGLSIGQVVDLEAIPDYDSNIEYKWVVQKLDLDAHKDIRKQERKLVDDFRKKEMYARKRRALEIAGMSVDDFKDRAISLPKPEKNEPPHQNREPETEE